MDQEPEDWEEREKIKAEIKKAEMAGDQENEGNLAHLRAEEFAAKKGFSRDPEDFRRSGEKLSSIAATLAILGLFGAVIIKFIIKNISSIHASEARADNEAALRALGIALTVFDILIGVAGVLGAAGVVAVVIYHQQTGKNLKHVLSASILSIIIALIWTFIGPWI